MKNSINNKSFILLVILSFLIGSVPVHAATLLNPNILNYIETYFDSKVPGFLDDVDLGTSKIVNDNNKDISKYIVSSTEQVISSIDQHISEEVNRVDNELSAYMEILFQEFLPVMDVEEARLKEVLTFYVDTQISFIKEEIYNELSLALHQHLIEEIVPN